CQVPRRFGGATLAGESDLGTNLGDVVIAQQVHVELVCPGAIPEPRESKGVGSTSFAGIVPLADGRQVPPQVTSIGRLDGKLPLRCYPETSYGSKSIARAAGGSACRRRGHRRRARPPPPSSVRGPGFRESRSSSRTASWHAGGNLWARQDG